MPIGNNRRSLNVAFYTDPYVENLSRDEQDVFLTLLLNPLNNLAGVYEISIKKIADFAKMDQDAVRDAVNKLADDGKILYIHNWLAIKNHIKNQSLNPNMALNVIAILKEVPQQMTLFVLADRDGNLEKWTRILLEKVQEAHERKEKRIAAREGREPNLITYTEQALLTDVGTSNTSNIKPFESVRNPSERKKEEEGSRKNESEEGSRKYEYEKSNRFEPYRPENQDTAPNVKGAAHWYNGQASLTTLLVSPSDKDFQAAHTALQQVSGDLEIFEACADYYWQHYPSIWYYEKNRRHSFTSFCANIAELVEPATREIRSARVVGVEVTDREPLSEDDALNHFRRVQEAHEA